MVLYDVTTSYYEGQCCSLAQCGHNRDGKKGKKIIVYGVMTDAQGRPVAVDVYEGNTGASTVTDQVEKLRKRFGLEHVVLVGDQGMLTQTQVNKLRNNPNLGWISALRARHWNEDRVRAHIFLCMLAYYVEWHMRNVLRPLLFDDEQREVMRKHRDPVAKAKPSKSAKQKKHEKLTTDGFPVHSFDTLLTLLGTRCKNYCRPADSNSGSTFTQLTELTDHQKRAIQLLQLYPVS